MTSSQKNNITHLSGNPARYCALYCRVARKLGVSRQRVARVAAGTAISKRILAALIQELTELEGGPRAASAPASRRAAANSGTPAFDTSVTTSDPPLEPCSGMTQGVLTEIELRARGKSLPPPLASPPQAAPHGAPTFAPLSERGASSLSAKAC
jgi:hypothetical protein